MPLGDETNQMMTNSDAMVAGVAQLAFACVPSCGPPRDVRGAPRGTDGGFIVGEIPGHLSVLIVRLGFPDPMLAPPAN